jgi:cob(I)alamin adenosyltransferase
MRLDTIYSRGGDDGRTSLGDGQRLPKFSRRVAAYGGVDEANASIGVALLYLTKKEIAETLRLVQNDLVDPGSDPCRPERTDAKTTPLRGNAGQVARLEQQDRTGWRCRMLNRPCRDEPRLHREGHHQ